MDSRLRGEASLRSAPHIGLIYSGALNKKGSGGVTYQLPATIQLLGHYP